MSHADLAAEVKIVAQALRAEHLWSSRLAGHGPDLIDGRISYTKVQGMYFARIQLVLDLAVPAHLVAVKPEVLSQSASEQPSHFPQIQVVRQFSPGCALVQVDYRAAVNLKRLWTVLVGERVHWSHGNRQHAHFLVRSHFPSVGESMMAIAATSGDASTRMSELDVAAMHVVMFSPHRTLRHQIVLSHIFRVRGLQFPLWATAYLRDLALAERTCWMNYMASSQFQSLRQKDERFYMILNLKCCVRGLPFLPEPHGASTATLGNRIVVHGLTWVKPRTVSAGGLGTFTLTAYLRDFLSLTGCPPVEVYDHVNGLAVVPYQTVVPRHQWEAAEEGFQWWFRDQQAAYRRLNAVKSAPRIVEVDEVRWKVVTEPHGAQWTYFSVRNTFIQEITSEDTFAEFQTFGVIPAWQRCLQRAKLLRSNSI